MHFWSAVYQTSDATDEPPKGLCEKVETCVFIETSDVREAIDRLMKVCEAACMGLQTAMNSVPTSIELVYKAKDGHGESGTA